jgi:hypothetical protein
MPPDLPEESDPEIAKTRSQILLDLRLTQRNKNPDITTEHNLPGLDNLVDRVTNIIPRSRLDRLRKERVCIGTVPIDAPYDCRGHLNEKQAIQEQCLGEIPWTTSQDSSQESIEEILSEGGGARPITLWESQQTGAEMTTQDMRGVKTAPESKQKRR